MSNRILFFSTPGSQEGLGFLAKSQVSSYTKKDGTFVASHADKRQKKAAVGSGPKKASAEMIQAITEKHRDKMNTYFHEWDHKGEVEGKIPKDELAGLPTFTQKEVYGHDRKVSPEGDDFSPEFQKKGHTGFILQHNNGHKSYVDSHGYRYARYHGPIES